MIEMLDFRFKVQARVQKGGNVPSRQLRLRLLPGILQGGQPVQKR